MPEYQDQCTPLTEYGITRCCADTVAHVCFFSKKLHIFGTKEMNEYIRNNKDKLIKKPVFVNGKQTAEGYIIPVKDLEKFTEWFETLDLNTVWTPEKVEKLLNYTTSELGRIAENVCLKMFEEYHPVRCTSKEDQIRGKDIYITDMDIYLEAKGEKFGSYNDTPGYELPKHPKMKSLTGNLFIQTHEVNEKGAH